MACRVGGVAGFGSRGARLPAGSDLGCKGPGFDCRGLLDFFALGQLYTDWDTRFAERRVHTYLDGPGEQLTNGSFEDWTAGNPDGWGPFFAALTQVAWAPVGWGSSALRITNTAGALGRALLLTDDLVVGARYRLLGVMAGDGGTGAPHVRLSSGTGLFTGTSAAGEQVVDVEFTADATRIHVCCQGAGIGDFADCAGLSVEELPRAEVLNHPTLAARMLADPAVLDRCDALCAALASCPVWDDEEQALNFFGGEYLTAHALAAKYSGAGRPLLGMFVLENLSPFAGRLLGVGWSINATPFHEIYYVNPNATPEVGRRDSTSAVAVVTDGAVSPAGMHVYAHRFDGTAGQHRTNAVAGANGPLPVGVASLDALALGCRIRVMAPLQFFQGLLQRAAMGGVAEAGQVEFASRWLMSAHGV